MPSLATYNALQAKTKRLAKLLGAEYWDVGLDCGVGLYVHFERRKSDNASDEISEYFYDNRGLHAWLNDKIRLLTEGRLSREYLFASRRI